MIYVSELPPELEFETIFSRMEELIISSQLLPLPSWYYLNLILIYLIVANSITGNLFKWINEIHSFVEIKIVVGV